MAESNPLLERCRAFVEQQSCGEWDDKTINDDAAKLHDFVLLEIARADLVEPLVEALRFHQLWEKREKEGPLYPFGVTRDTPEGEKIWRAWWNDQLRLCELSHVLTDSALTRFREAQAGGGA